MKNEKYCIDNENADEVIADILNAINRAIAPLGYVAVGYENGEVFLNVLIDKKFGG